MTKINIWNGITRTDCIDNIGARHGLADAAKKYDWACVFGLLEEHPELINVTRPGASSLYTPLHQAAYGAAPAEVVHRLIELGA